MRVALCTLVLCFLSACGAANKAAAALARDQAKTVVNGVVEARLPGVNVAPVTDCIIDAASAPEILSIARASVTGVSDSTVNLVLEISQRPESVTCIAENSLLLVGG